MLQTTLAVQEIARFTLPFEECPSDREHSPSGACGTWWGTAPPVTAVSAFKGKTTQKHLARPLF